jgi:exo-1,4-beta-D-glucosaminidase
MDVINPATHQPILPVYWNDNYVTLLPGEERVYEASYYLSDSDGTRPIVAVKGWNVENETIK